MLFLFFYVPKTHLEVVKSALFQLGLGRYAEYDSCSWEVLGTGQFRPLQGSSPFIGQRGVIEQVDEYRVELLCPPPLKAAAIKALKAVHPYEEPAYGFLVLETG